MYIEVDKPFIPTINGIEPAKIVIYSEAIDASVEETKGQLQNRFELPFMIYEGKIEIELLYGFDPEIAFPRITNVVDFVKELEYDRFNYKTKNKQLEAFANSLNQPTKRGE